MYRSQTNGQQTILHNKTLLVALSYEFLAPISANDLAKDGVK
jgi:hypothetical protein